MAPKGNSVLEKSEEAIPAAIVESSSDATIGEDLRGKITYWNKAAERLLGYEAAEVIGRPIHLLAPREAIHAEAELLRGVSEGRPVEPFDAIRVRKDGTRVEVSVTMSPIKDATDRIIGASQIVRDITARKNDERDLRRRAEELNAFLETAQIGMHRVGPDGTILWANEAELHLLGYRADEYIGRHIAEFHADETAVNEILGTLGGGDKLYEYDQHVLDRAVFGFEPRFDSRVFWKDGRFTHTQCTARKGLEQSLHESQQLLRGIIDNTPAVIYVKDFDGRCLLINRRYAELFHITAEALAGKTDHHHLPKPVADRTRAVDKRVALTDAPVVEEEVLPLDDGPHTFISVKCPLRDPALLGMHAENLNAEGREFLLRVGTAAKRMNRLILDVLNYSRIVRSDLSLERVPLEPLLRDIVATYPMFAADKAEIELSKSLPAVLGNEAMLTQIFSNLLGNAVKFTAPGKKPRVKVWSESRGPYVRVLIQDNGIGIAENQHRKIFDIFQQATTGFGGTGIGLAIVKKAAERMGGQVGVWSTPGEGSTFWVETPCAD